MSQQFDLFSVSPTDSTGDDAGTDPAAAASGPASHDGAHLPVPPQAMASIPSLDDSWHWAFESYGLMRPTEVTEIHVYRVILQSYRDKNACTRSVTKAGPMSDPVQTLGQIIEKWWDLEIEEHDQSWKFSSVNCACTWSPNKDLSYPAYVLTRMGNPFHLLRPHGVIEVLWGHRLRVTAIALPKWAHACLVVCYVV